MNHLIGKLHSMDSIAVFTSADQTPQKFFFRDTCEEFLNQRQDVIYRQQMDAQKNDPAISSHGITQNISKIRITSDQDHGISFDQFIDLLIRGCRFYIANIRNFMTKVFEYGSDGAGAVSIKKKLHELTSRLKFLFIGEESGIKDAGLNIFFGNRAIFFLDLFKAHSGRQRFENDMNRYTGPFDARLAMLDHRIHNDSLFKNSFIEHVIFILDELSILAGAILVKHAAVIRNSGATTISWFVDATEIAVLKKQTEVR